MDRTAEKEKPEPLLKSKALRNRQAHVMGAPWHSLHVPPHSSVPFSQFSFHLSHHFRLLFLNLFISASRSNFTKTETLWPLEIEQTCGCAASFTGGVGGLRAPLSVGTVLWNPMHSLTRGQTAAPKGVVQSWSLEIVSFSLVHGCKLMGFMHSAGIFIDRESTRRYWRTGVNKASKPGTCKILYN